MARAETRQYTVYKAVDGTEFTTYEDACAYEEAKWSRTAIYRSSPTGARFSDAVMASGEVALWEIQIQEQRERLNKGGESPMLGSWDDEWVKYWRVVDSSLFVGTIAKVMGVALGDPTIWEAFRHPEKTVHVVRKQATIVT